MGGKNAIIVDETADLDEAITGVVVSFSGYAGQKCSACSRVIVHRSVLRLIRHTFERGRVEFGDR
ncbi:MAG: aldehyde dehydrogenase family protein [Nitrospira sp.]|nr:aldehyde dehydrogenase family protein [Nitrospira sp.]